MFVKFENPFAKDGIQLLQETKDVYFNKMSEALALKNKKVVEPPKEEKPSVVLQSLSEDSYMSVDHHQSEEMKEGGSSRF